MNKKSTKKICLRCGQKFTKLKSHLSKKKTCESKYLDISMNNMLDNYSSLFVKYLEKVNENKFKCPNCEKYYTYQSGLSKHKKNCKSKFRVIKYPDNSDIDDNFGSFVDKSNFNVNFISFNINNYGHEKYKTNSFYKVFNDKYEMSKTKDGQLTAKGHHPKLISDLFKHLYVDIPKNRCIYLQDIKSGFIKILSDGEWIYENKKIFLNETVINHIINILKKFSNFVKNEMGVTSNHTYISTRAYYDAIETLKYEPNEIRDVVKQITLYLINNKNVIAESINESIKLLEEYNSNIINNNLINIEESNNKNINNEDDKEKNDKILNKEELKIKVI